MNILFLVAVCFLFSLGIWILVGRLWSPFRKFFHKNYSFFDASFILAYFLEQLAFVILINKFSVNIPFWAGIFGILVVTTASFQKLMLESRFKEISETTTEQKILLERSSENIKELINKNKILEKTIGNMKEFILEWLEEER